MAVIDFIDIAWLPPKTIVGVLRNFHRRVVVGRDFGAVIKWCRSGKFNGKPTQVAMSQPDVVADRNIIDWILDKDCSLVVSVNLLRV